MGRVYRGQEAGNRDSGSGNRDQGTGIREPETGVREPALGGQTQGRGAMSASLALDLVPAGRRGCLFRFPSPGSLVPNPGSLFPLPGSRIPFRSAPSSCMRRGLPIETLSARRGAIELKGLADVAEGPDR